MDNESSRGGFLFDVQGDMDDLASVIDIRPPCACGKGPFVMAASLTVEQSE